MKVSLPRYTVYHYEPKNMMNKKVENYEHKQYLRKQF